MKTFELPVSDCGCFLGGELPEIDHPPGDPNKPWPKYGVIVWYETEEACKAAVDAASKAHW